MYVDNGCKVTLKLVISKMASLLLFRLRKGERS